MNNLLPHRTPQQNYVIKSLIAGYESHMTWWLAPNPGEPYSDVIMLLGGKHIKINPQGHLEKISTEEYQQQWSIAFRAGLEIDEFHELSVEEWKRLNDPDG